MTLPDTQCVNELGSVVVKKGSFQGENKYIALENVQMTAFITVDFIVLYDSVQLLWGKDTYV